MSRRIGPPSTRSVGFTSASRTKIGTIWNDASSTIAAITAPGNTSRTVTGAFVSSRYAASTNANTPRTETAIDST